MLKTARKGKHIWLFLVIFSILLCGRVVVGPTLVDDGSQEPLDRKMPTRVDISSKPSLDEKDYAADDNDKKKDHDDDKKSVMKKSAMKKSAMKKEEKKSLL